MLGSDQHPHGHARMTDREASRWCVRAGDGYGLPLTARPAMIRTRLDPMIPRLHREQRDVRGSIRNTTKATSSAAVSVEAVAHSSESGSNRSSLPSPHGGESQARIGTSFTPVQRTARGRRAVCTGAPQCDPGQVERRIGIEADPDVVEPGRQRAHGAAVASPSCAAGDRTDVGGLVGVDPAAALDLAEEAAVVVERTAGALSGRPRARAPPSSPSVGL